MPMRVSVSQRVGDLDFYRSGWSAFLGGFGFTFLGWVWMVFLCLSLMKR